MEKSQKLLILFSLIILLFCLIMLNDYHYNPEHWIFNDGKGNATITAVSMKGIWPKVIINSSQNIPVNQEKDVLKVVKLQKTPKVIVFANYFLIICLLIVICCGMIATKRWYESLPPELKGEGGNQK